MDDYSDQNGRSEGASHEGGKKNDGTESVDKNSALDINHAVLASTFDYSVDNFFAEMDSISALCGAPSDESFGRSEIERFSSMITFLKEWKQFKYESKTIKFANEIGSEQVEDVYVMKLSQFSSATVPKIEKLPDERRCLDSDDFVLHAGGPVWALDWRPRTDETLECNIKCEYLAVAAHPPGSMYNKIGVPLVGRGVIQIWSLLSLDEKVEFSPRRPTDRGRSRKVPKREEPAFDSKAEEVSTTPKPRGRPKKKPFTSVDDINGSKDFTPKRPRGRPRKQPSLVLNGVKESPPTRPRGRPRKRPLPILNDLNDKLESPLSSTNLNLCMNECIPSLNVDLGGLALSMPVPADLTGKVESFSPRHTGRRKKKLTPKIKECFPASDVEFWEDSSKMPTSRGRNFVENTVGLPVSDNLNGQVASSVPRRRGRPRKMPIPSMNECVPTPGLHSVEDSSSLPTSRGFEVLSEKGVALPVPVDSNAKMESFPPRCRGRPRKTPIPSVVESVPASGIDVGKDSSSLPTSRGSGTLIKKGRALLVPADLNAKVESYVPRRRGRPRKTPISSVHECVPASRFEFRVDSSVLSTSGRLGTLSENGCTGGSQIVETSVTQSCEDFNNRTIASESGSAAYIVEQMMIDKERAVASDNVADGSMPVVNGNELSVTVVPENCENAVPVTCETDNGVARKACEGLNRVQFAVECGTTTCIQKRRIKGKGRASSSLNSSNSNLSPIREQKQLAGTVVPTPGKLCQDGMNLSKDVGQKMSLIPKDTALPKIVFCLAHNGKVAWDIKWRPSNVNTSEGKHHLGYLAVLLGNGSLEVWEIPLPGMVKILYTSSRTEGTDPRFLKLEPMFRCSKVKCGGMQSIPLTVEWSPSASRDLILAGCHDGTVALWKFSTQYSSQDTKPLLCFTADSVPIRALAWAPEESNAESANLIVTAGHEGLKFWDIRDPYRPLWDLNPVQRVILSLDWLKDPRCIILAFDDGTLRTLSLLKASSDVPVTGQPFGGTKQQGLHTSLCSPFAIWSVQVSRTTGLAAYCSADGSARRFQVTAKAVDKDSSRYREPHYLCGSLVEEGQVLKINTPLPNIPLPKIPLPMKKPPNELGDAPRTICGFLSDTPQARRAKPSVSVVGSGNDCTPPAMRTTSTRNSKNKPNPSPKTDQTFREAEEEKLHSSERRDDGLARKLEEFPSKIVAMHRVRWNMNKGSERWLCYGGAAGIIRCHRISLTATQ